MRHQRWTLAVMFAAVALVALVLFLDEQSEFESAVENLKEEQIALATAVGTDFQTRLSRLEQSGPLRLDVNDYRTAVLALLGGSVKLERPRSRVLLVCRPKEGLILTTAGERIISDTLVAAMRSGVSGLLIARDESPRFGLPRRIALAGIEAVKARGGDWAVVVLASGERLRARERYAQLRFLLSLTGVTGIILAFGGVAIRQRQRQLAAARALELSRLEREREKLLAKADKMATLAALSSGIAHEVATPLGTIMGRVEQLLLTSEGDARAKSALQAVLEQVERIQAIIRGVLGLARGEMPPLVPAKPSAIVQNGVTLSRHRFERAGVELVLDLSDDLPEIACDPPMLEQALTNLLLNACDASSRGSTVKLTVQSEGKTLCFAVVDEGEGIPPELAERAKEPFFTTKGGRGGNGLGLAITREVVAHHGGKLRLEPRQSARGTRAIIELPRA